MADTLYTPDWDSIRAHSVPQWYNDVKLGIFIHWGLYSVPAWAEVTWELGGEPSPEEWFMHNPYAEWYQNTLRIKASPAWAHHVKTYGEDFPYRRFADGFTCERWEPAEWARLFKDAGAGYVVLTTKHHDGFCLYPSQYTQYNSMEMGPRRDLMGDLAEAVRAEGIKMGVYYSGLLDWTTVERPILRHDAHNTYNQTYAFADYSLNQFMEIIDAYKPSLLFNDIGWPRKGLDDLPYLFAHYYNSVPDGVVNDRWSGAFHDYTTAEYLTGARPLGTRWEMCRGLGLSFGYNRNEGEDAVLSSHALIRLLVEYVSHNGNLLINIGPRADGTIPEIQASRLRALGAWLKRHGEAIYGTTIWSERQTDKLDGGAQAFYTRKGADLYAIVDGLDKGAHSVKLPFMDSAFDLSCEDALPCVKKLGGFFTR